MNRIAIPSSANVWRIAAVCLLGAMVGLLALNPADAGPRKTKVMQTTKVVVENDFLPGGAGNDVETVAECPAGWQVTGGGIDFDDEDPGEEVAVVWNGPLIQDQNLVARSDGRNPAGNAWRVRVENNSGVGFDYAVGAICAKRVKVIN